VASFLRAAVQGGSTSHAYLFVGPAGSGKRTAALLLACALVCEDGGCGTCAACARVRRGAHPDVRVLAPEGASGYLVEQIDVYEAAVADAVRPQNQDGEVHCFECLSPAEVAERLSAEAFTLEAALILWAWLERRPTGFR